ncbi:hypothetical protein [Microbulbifer aggregans]|uniref:hypothetical protein n=1 Tax=Microbulbifer aggregans TaxID=1769779 RepID=UPI001CFEB256|nr:hypothetical protein [Microbulbifer aggregans]
MSFRIRFDARNRVARMLFYGEATYENRVEAIRQLIAKYGHLKPLRVLADVRKVQSMSMTAEEQARLGTFAGRTLAAHGARIAVLNSNQLNTTAVIRHRARDEGLELFHFLTEGEALSWLTSSAELPG